MNRDELLAAAAAEHLDWADEYGDEVEADPADSNPHDGVRSDYAEHHADRSAPAKVDDVLSSKLVALIGEHRERASHQPAPGTVKAAAAPPPGSPQQIQQQWETARADMLAAWPETAQPMVDELAAQAEAAVEAGDLGALGTLAVSAGVVAAVALMLAGGAVGLAGEAAAGVVAEAASHQVDITAPDEPGAARVGQTADAIAGIIAAGYASGAARTALHVAGAGPAEVRAAVERHLDGLSAAERGMVADQLGTLLSAAQHAGRLAAFEQMPPTTRYRAVEEAEGPSRCKPCGDIAGREYRTLRAGLADYPALGYRECAGGARCRGGLHPIYS